MRIALDIDGVLANTHDHFLRWFNLPLYPAKDFNDTRFSDERFELISGNMEFWLNVPAYFNGKDLKFDIVGYVTARSVPDEITKKWLLKNGFPNKKLVSLGSHNKVDALKEMTVDLFVEDKYDNFVEINKSGIKCLLMSRSYNENRDGKGLRINSINEVLKFL